MLGTLGFALSIGKLMTLGPGEPEHEMPVVRILVGGGMQATATELEAAVYADGRVEAPRIRFRDPPSAVKSLVHRLRKLGLYALTQGKLDGAISRSSLAPPSMRPGSGLYAIEFQERGAMRHVEARNPEHYRGNGLREVDVFLAAYAEVKAFAHRTPKAKPPE